MVSSRGFSASVVCDNKPLEEYDVTEDTDSAIRCFIASESGKNFFVKIKNDTKDDAAIDIFLDGIHADDCIIHAEDEDTSTGTDVSNTTCALFAFGTVNLTDDEQARNPGSRLIQAIGSIEVRVHRVKNFPADSSESVNEDVIAASFYQKARSNFTNEPVHESSKKAGYHQIILGELVKTRGRQFLTVDYIDPKNKPYATLTYMYRPRNILQAQGIIPLPPTTKATQSTQPTQSTSQSQSAKRNADNTNLPRNQKKQKSQKSASTPTVPETDVKPRMGEIPDRDTGDSDGDSDSEAELRMMKETLAALQKRIGKMEKRRKAKKAGPAATKLPE